MTILYASFSLILATASETKQKVINGSRRYAVTEENIDKMMNYELFAFEEYCKKCFEPIDKRPEDRILDIVSAGKVL